MPALKSALDTRASKDIFITLARNSNAGHLPSLPLGQLRSQPRLHLPNDERDWGSLQTKCKCGGGLQARL